MRQAYTEGRLIMAALFENGSGINNLLEAETETEIQKFVRNNPEVIEKKMQARIKMCRPLFRKKFSLDV